MSKISQPLCRAFGACASQCHAILVTHNWCAALGTGVRHFESDCVFRSFFFIDRKYLGDYFTGFLDQYSVTYPYIKPINIILIMQGCISHGSAGKSNGFYDRLRGQNTCSSHLNNYIHYPAFLLFGRIFICNCPSWGFCGTAEHQALLK